MGEVERYFTALRQVYEEHGAESDHELQLARGVTKRALQKAAKAIGGPLDPGLVALWRYAGGSAGAPVFQDGKFLTSYALLSVEEALEERSVFEWRAPQYDGTVESDEPRDPRVGEGWFSPGWLPFAAIEGGSVRLLVDHAPLGTGRPGQIISYVHDPDEIRFVADSLLELLPVSLAAIQDDPLEFLQVY